MIIAKRFIGDNNHFVMKIQHDEYGNMLTNLVTMAKNSYFQFEWYAMIDPQLKKRIQSKEHIDHRILQWAHDIIAGVFRYLLCPRDEIDYSSYNFDFKSYILDSWRSFYESENMKLATIKEIQLAILQAIAYQNTTTGNAAEEKLILLLFNRYPFIDQPPFVDELKEKYKA